jgi:hypothetical protein
MCQSFDWHTPYIGCDGSSYRVSFVLRCNSGAIQFSDELLIYWQRESILFFNLEISSKPEWFPGNEIPIGAPERVVPASIGSFWRSDWQVYIRTYSNGLVLVNSGEKEKKIDLFQRHDHAIPFGDGSVPENGNTSGWVVDFAEEGSVTVGPHQGEIPLNSIPE